MHQHGYEQAPPRIIEDPGDDDREGDGRKNEEHKVSQFGQQIHARTSCLRVSQEEGKMPASPEHPKDEASQQGAIAMLQAWQCEAAPAGFFPSSVKHEGEGESSGIDQQ